MKIYPGFKIGNDQTDIQSYILGIARLKSCWTANKRPDLSKSSQFSKININVAHSHIPSRLCREESKVFRFFASIFSHILTCLLSDSGTNVLPHTWHGLSGSGPEGSGATGTGRENLELLRVLGSCRCVDSYAYDSSITWSTVDLYESSMTIARGKKGPALNQ